VTPRTLACSLALLLYAHAARAADLGLDPQSTTTAGDTRVTSIDSTTFVPPSTNERMEYTVSYLGITIGKAALFSGKVDASTAPIFLQAKTASIAAMFTLKQQLASYVDPATGLPRAGQLDAVEGSYRHTDTFAYDRTALPNRATVREKSSTGKDETRSFDLPLGTIDFVSLVYRLRHLTLEPGTKYTFHVLTGRILSTAVVEVVGREELSTGIGKLPTVKVRVPTAFAGKFAEKNPSFVWLTDDARRIVARIATDFAVGHATASLDSYVPGEPQPAQPAVAAEPASVTKAPASSP
jgi:hypothetical protein